MEREQRLLLIDTCGETAGVALSTGLKVLASEDLARGSASAEIVLAVRKLLEQAAWRLRDLDAIGVVNGPGSFTGMRAGLATAKGLCEAGGLMLAAVSRLEVLADAASMTEGLAVLDAGRGEFYVREIASGRESLCSGDDLEELFDGRSVVVAEERVAERFARCEPVLHALHVADSLVAVMRCVGLGGSDVALIDANYVRGEKDLYRKQEQGEKSPLAAKR